MIINFVHAMYYYRIYYYRIFGYRILAAFLGKTSSFLDSLSFLPEIVKGKAFLSYRDYFLAVLRLSTSTSLSTVHHTVSSSH